MGQELINGPVILDIPADPASLFLVRALLGKLFERIGFTREESDRLILAVDEACTNIIKHAYKDCRGEQRIVLTFSVKVDYFEAVIRDFGHPAEPASFLPRNLEELRPGGLGTHFIRSAVDKVEYSVPPDGCGMLLKLTKFRSQETGQN